MTRAIALPAASSTPNGLRESGLLMVLPGFGIKVSLQSAHKFGKPAMDSLWNASIDGPAKTSRQCFQAEDGACPCGTALPEPSCPKDLTISSSVMMIGSSLASGSTSFCLCMFLLRGQEMACCRTYSHFTSLKFWRDQPDDLI